MENNNNTVGPNPAKKMKQEYRGPQVHVRMLPEWVISFIPNANHQFDAAKFGIFIHWGVYSVPAWADHNQEGIDKPCAEWYYRKLQSPLKDKSATRNHHFKTYGPAFKYQQFGPMFTASDWNPDEWADLFAETGAKYVVLTSKHHDGFCLFSTKTAPNWNSVEVGPKRDLVKDLKEAVTKKNMKFGLYYSLYEWYNTFYLSDKKKNSNAQKKNQPANFQVYVNSVVLPQLKEIVTQYQPDIVWGDGDWEQTASYWKTQEFFEWLYNDSPVASQVVANDRFGKDAKQKFSTYSNSSDRFVPSELPNYKWECCYTITNSWGYNQEFPESKMKSTFEILRVLIEVVSLGGNFLLNVGPTASGKLIESDIKRLKEIGQFMKINGEAIYGTKPALVQKQKISSDVDARFTWIPDTETFYLFLINLQEPQNENSNSNEDSMLDITLNSFLKPAREDSSIELMATKEPIKFSVDSGIQFNITNQVLDQHRIVVLKLSGFVQNQSK